ncbi:S66 peptidase family protein [Brassicibacter mesophilus]|uniref:S66 peptidase family protein n=1 Tax=Brassicibacter mesophilus TaxID=745119 RepID=UPI003D24A433
MIKPKPLKNGDTIGLIGPSSPTPFERIEPSIERIKELGFNVVVGESCYGVHGYLSGKDEVRAKDVNEMFRNKNIDGVWCIRGGYGTPRILDMLDYDLIRQNPKVFIGYSDITALHISINQECELVTFHGPMVSTELYRGIDDFTRDYLIKNIMGHKSLGLITNPKNIDIKTLVSGKCEGKIVGGNLSLVASTIGTPFEIDTKGKILFLEDVDEEPYRIDRMLTQLKLAGKLDDAEGFILGDWNNCVSEEPNKSLTLFEIFNELIVPIGKPTIYNFMAGHCDPMITLPFGVNSKLDADNKKLFIDESATNN